MLRFLLLAAFLAPACVSAQPFTAADSTHVVQRAQTIVDTLTAPSMRGRGYLGDADARAAAYLAERFEEAGLEPVGGSYLQGFAFPAILFPETPELIVNGERLDLGVDVVPLRASASGAGEARVVDVGFGLHAPQVGLSDYEGKDADGAVVVLRRDVPEAVREDAPDSTLTLAARVAAAEAHGARAVVVLVETLAFGGGGFEASVPVFEVHNAAWPADADSVRYAVTKVVQPVETQNVVGLLPGTAEADSVVVVMAHYDGQGALGPDFSFPGANDNASGTSALVLLAEALAAEPLPYSVLFVATSGEEQGLWGARYLAAYPPVPLDQIAFLLNLDMVASGERGLVAVGGRDHPARYAQLESANEGLDAGPLRARRNAPISDHFPLMAQGVPGLYVYTDAGTQPYHHALDVGATLEWEDWWHVYRLALTFLRSAAG